MTIGQRIEGRSIPVDMNQVTALADELRFPHSLLLRRGRHTAYAFSAQGVEKSHGSNLWRLAQGLPAMIIDIHGQEAVLPIRKVATVATDAFWAMHRLLSLEGKEQLPVVRMRHFNALARYMEQRAEEYCHEKGRNGASLNLHDWAQIVRADMQASDPVLYAALFGEDDYARAIVETVTSPRVLETIAHAGLLLDSESQSKRLIGERATQEIDDIIAYSMGMCYRMIAIAKK